MNQKKPLPGAGNPLIDAINRAEEIDTCTVGYGPFGIGVGNEFPMGVEMYLHVEPDLYFGTYTPDPEKPETFTARFVAYTFDDTGISIANKFSWNAARKRDEMLEPYEWKRSRTVLRRESGSNPADLVDYREITEALGGSYLDLTDGRNRINVLEPRMWSAEDKEPDPEAPAAFQSGSLLSQHIAFLRDFFRSYKPFTEAEIDTIEIMLGRLYDSRGLRDDTDYSRLSPRDYPILSDLYDQMDAEYQRVRTGSGGELYTPELLRSACLGLHSMCKGADAKFFNGHTNIHDTRLITFGVKDLMEGGKNIKDAMLFNVLSYINHALIAGGNTAGVFEELHVFLSNPVAVSYIRSAMKRVRKRDSLIGLASQNIEDFLLPGVAEMTKPLFSIPVHHFLFHPGAIDKRGYMDALQLEETEYQLILACQTGSCLYRCGAERYNLVVKTPEHKLALYGSGGGR